MVFVVLGTQPFQMNRLLIMVDELIEHGKLKENVFAQIGSSNYVPKYFQYKRFLSQSEFDTKMSECRVLLTHCGVGTIISGLKKNKPIIVVPRLAKYREHVDDHQMEIAKTFEEKDYVLEYIDGKDLGDYFLRLDHYKFESYTSEKAKMCATISAFLENLCKN